MVRAHVLLRVLTSDVGAYTPVFVQDLDIDDYTLLDSMGPEAECRPRRVFFMYVRVCECARAYYSFA